MKTLLLAALICVTSASMAQDTRLSEGYIALRQGNFEKASVFFAQAANGGEHEAQYQLGKLYLAGRGVTRNETEAHRWLQQAAEGGNPGAQYTLGLLLLDRPDQREQGKAWLEQAATNKHQLALTELESLEQADQLQQEAGDNTVTMSRWQQASVSCREPVLAEMLHAGFDVNHRDDYQRNALYYLVACDNLEGAALLIDRGIDVNTVDAFGEDALSLAVKRDAVAMAEILVDAGAHGPLTTDHSTLLHIAVARTSTDMLPILLRARPQLDAVDSAGNTALDIAIARRNREAQRLLIAAGANATAASQYEPAGDTWNWSRARQATLQSQADTLAAMLDSHGEALLNREDEQHRTLLMYAVEADSAQVATLLAERGAAIDQLNASGDTALMLAIGSGSINALQVLLDHGANSFLRDQEGNDAFMRALGESKKNPAAKILLAQIPVGSLPPGLADQYLLEASRASLLPEIHKLLAHGARDGATDAMDRTATWYAAANCDQASLAKLLARNGSPGHRDTNGYTPLHIAAANDCPQVVDTLLSSGADLEARTNQGNTPLILAVQQERESMALTLLQQGANVSAQNDKGDTALIRAVNADSARLITALLELGADAYRRNSFGDSALILAQRTAPELAELIEDRDGFLF